MECHKCPFREKLEAGEYAQVPYDETPCAKCELNEYSDRTIEFDQERENQSASASGTTADMVSSFQSAEYFREGIKYYSKDTIRKTLLDPDLKNLRKTTEFVKIIQSRNYNK
jgi:hypothetical protein